MQIVDYSKIPSQEWDNFCKSSSTAWFWHTSTRINFVLNLDFIGNSINRSFAIYRNATIVCIVPLIEVNTESLSYRELSYGRGINTPYPAFSDDISGKASKKLEKLIFEKILEIDNVAYISFFVQPLTDKVLSKQIITNPLTKFGFHDTTITTNILCLGKPENELFREIRKGHKSDIKRGIKNGYTVEVVNSNNFSIDKFNGYREVHFQAAGRQTRSDETWDIMQDWVRNDLAVLALCKKGESVLGATLVDTFKQKAYYHSQAILPEYQKEKGIGHLMQWEIIKYLTCHGFTHYELGWNWYPNISQEVADQKLLGISRFKAGFGGEQYPLFRGEYFFNINYMEQIYLDRLNAYKDLTNKKY